MDSGAYIKADEMAQHNGAELPRPRQMVLKRARCFQKMTVLVLNSAGPDLGRMVCVRLSGDLAATPSSRHRGGLIAAEASGEHADEGFEIHRINLFGAFSFFF